MKLKFSKSIHIEGSLKAEPARLYKLYVLTPADKASNNIIFTCKSHYFKKIKEELSGSGNNTYQLSNTTFDNVIQKKLSGDHYWSQ
jgi:hypothetical protein